MYEKRYVHNALILASESRYLAHKTATVISGIQTIHIHTCFSVTLLLISFALGVVCGRSFAFQVDMVIFGF